MDLYLILGVTRVATPADIKRAYKRLARRHHPDINPGDGTAVVRFRQITEAYETLIDPDRRRGYDVSGSRPAAASPDSTYGFEGFDFSASVAGPRATTFGDLFAEMFGRGAPTSAAPERGADLHDRVALGFEASMRGIDSRVPVTRREVCRACSGTGTEAAAEARCHHCAGTGTLRSARGHMVFAKTCPHCGGTGQLRRHRCAACRGEGVEARSETIAFRVPAGVRDGARVRVPGKGHAGRLAGGPGDLYVTVQVAEHPLFRREGDDLHLVVPVAVHEAALGARIDVPSFDGPARVRVPPGTQSGQRFRVRERGAPSGRAGRRGDLVVEVRLALPKLLDEHAKELLRELGRVCREDVRADLFKQR
jgi:molecular chaperone DnaJ